MVYHLKVRRPSVPRLFDGFCGAGGSSLGCSWLGILVWLAINHDQKSLKTHQHNFPQARHDCVDITAIPDDALKDYPDCEFAWFSAECTNHSTSSGEPLLNQGQLSLWSDLDERPFVERSRSTMREVVRWAAARKRLGKSYLAILVENVPKVEHWSGIQKWREDLTALGYRLQTICFNSMFAQSAFPPEMASQVYPVAQSRDRWYTIATLEENAAPDLDIRPRAFCPECGCEQEAVQSWKPCALGRKWGDYDVQYEYRCPSCATKIVPFFTPASALIDWSLPMTRIGDYKKPLAETTLQRIERGLQRFCATDQEADRQPFLVNVANTKAGSSYTRSVFAPTFTQTQTQSLSVVLPPGSQPPPFIFYTLRSQEEVKRAMEKAARKRKLKGDQLQQFEQEYQATYQAQWQHYKEELPLYLNAYRQYPRPPEAARNAFVASYYGSSDVFSLVCEDVIGTCTQISRHGLVLPPAAFQGTAPTLEECFYRVLKSKEVKRAMGIPESYEILATSQREETRQSGLAVTPAVAALLMWKILQSLGEDPQLQACA